MEGRLNMYEISKTDWQNNNIPTAEDLKRIESNIEYLRILLG